jgi:hypothetical protein
VKNHFGLIVWTSQGREVGGLMNDLEAHDLRIESYARGQTGHAEEDSIDSPEHRQGIE